MQGVNWGDPPPATNHIKERIKKSVEPSTNKSLNSFFIFNEREKSEKIQLYLDN